jgi:hypothetical protein
LGIPTSPIEVRYFVRRPGTNTVDFPKFYTRATVKMSFVKCKGGFGTKDI